MSGDPSVPSESPGSLNIGGRVYDYAHAAQPLDGQFATFVNQRPAFATLSGLSPGAPTTFNIAGNHPLTPAQLAPFVYDVITASNPGDQLLLPTAAQLTAAFPGVPVGTYSYVFINNLTANPIAITPNVGSTVSGATSVPAQTLYTYLVQKVSAGHWAFSSTWLSPQTLGGVPSPVDVTHGGTGHAVFNPNAVLYGNGIMPLGQTPVNVGPAREFLSQTAGGAPVFGAIDAADLPFTEWAIMNPNNVPNTSTIAPTDVRTGSLGQNNHIGPGCTNVWFVGNNNTLTNVGGALITDSSFIGSQTTVSATLAGEIHFAQVHGWQNQMTVATGTLTGMTVIGMQNSVNAADGLLQQNTIIGEGCTLFTTTGTGQGNLQLGDNAEISMGSATSMTNNIVFTSSGIFTLAGLTNCDQNVLGFASIGTGALNCNSNWLWQAQLTTADPAGECTSNVFVYTNAASSVGSGLLGNCWLWGNGSIITVGSGAMGGCIFLGTFNTINVGAATWFNIEVMGSNNAPTTTNVAIYGTGLTNAVTQTMVFGKGAECYRINAPNVGNASTRLVPTIGDLNVLDAGQIVGGYYTDTFGAAHPLQLDTATNIDAANGNTAYVGQSFPLTINQAAFSQVTITANTGLTLNGATTGVAGQPLLLQFVCTGLGPTTYDVNLIWSDTSAGLATPVTVPNGGTGVATLTQFGVVIGENAGIVHVTAAGTTGQFLGANTGADPTWQTPPGSGFAGYPVTVAQGGTGNVGPANLGVVPYGTGAGNPMAFSNSGATNGQYFQVVAGVPTWTMGPLFVDQGGTGIAGGLTLGTLIQASGAGLAMSGIPASANVGWVLTTNGAGLSPTYQAVPGATVYDLAMNAATNSATVDPSATHGTAFGRLASVGANALGSSAFGVGASVGANSVSSVAILGAVGANASGATQVGISGVVNGVGGNLFGGGATLNNANTTALAVGTTGKIGLAIFETPGTTTQGFLSTNVTVNAPQGVAYLAPIGIGQFNDFVIFNTYIDTLSSTAPVMITFHYGDLLPGHAGIGNTNPVQAFAQVNYAAGYIYCSIFNGSLQTINGASVHWLLVNPNKLAL